ncbi:MAG: DUF4143 domain-containing protein [Pseudomonadota bacterium]
MAQHLRAWCDYAPGAHRLYFWQTRSKVEVDFVIYGDAGLLAVEVKNTRNPGPEDFRGLRSSRSSCSTCNRGEFLRSPPSAQPR